MDKKSTKSITSLFEPKSFAVIGASQDKSKIGFKVLNNIIQGGYKGKIYPVSPKGGEIEGLRVYKNLSEIDGAIDCASLVIPASGVVDAVRQCADAHVKNVQIITSGFSEVGNHKEEEQIAAISKSTGMRIVGPNMFGIFSSSASLNSTFSATPIKPGHVAILTQSGALGIAMIGKTAVDNIGLSAIVSLGNKVDVDEADLLEYLIDHEETKVILMYIEGVKEGEKLISIMRRITAVKPVVVLKSGTSARGAQAAASHTGSLAGSDEVFAAIARQSGMLRAGSLEEAFNWCKFLGESPMPKGNRCVIVTNGGGIGVLATDACEKYNIELFDDQSLMKKIYEPVTPSFGSTKNPIDLTGGANAADYNLALNASVGSNDLDATIALYCETAVFDSKSLGQMILDTYRNHKSGEKPRVYGVVGGEQVENAIASLKRERIPVYNEVQQAVSCMGAAYKYANYLKFKSDDIDEASLDLVAIENVIDKALADGRSFLLANESARVMSAAGIKIPGSGIAKNIYESIKIAERIGYPVVMKVVSRDILHKSDAGGVALNLLNKEEVIDAFEAIIQNCKAYKEDAIIDGIEVCEMVQRGVELIVGARRDSSFGPVVMCGLGGVYVEVMKDVTFRSVPLNKREATSMLKEIRSYPLLLGVRGEQRKDIDTVIDTIIKVGTIIKKCKRITDIEINPVVVYEQGKGAKAVDARILISK